MDISAPMVKRESPNQRQMTPKMNSKKVAGVIGVIVMASSATITAMGRMDWKDSHSLDLIRVSNAMCSFLENST